MPVEKMDNSKVKLGQMIRVKNQYKKAAANDRYVAICVEDEDGNNERCLLFSELALSDMEKIRFKFAFDRMIDGRLYSANIDEKDTYLMKAKSYNENSMILRLSKSQLKEAEDRAKNNPEDLLKKGWLTDMMD